MSKKLYVSDLDGTLVRSVFDTVDYEINERLVALLQSLKPTANIALVTSASRDTTRRVLNDIGLSELFDHVVTSADVDFIKPHPEGYLTCMAYFDTKAEDTIVFEDSKPGVQAAFSAGAMVCMVQW